MVSETKPRSFGEFYPYYLSEHQNPVCRRWHFVGSWLALVNIGAALYLGNARFILLALLCGYGCAWIGHFVFEKNRPATFKHPFYSFIGDWVMFKDILIGKISI